MQITVVGGGVAGLSAALKLGRLGHTVTLIERDRTAMPETPDAAFEWVRRGAPQVRHSHAFLGRLRTSLARNEPDVLEALLEAGATEMRFGDNLPPEMTNFVREPGDDELVMLACRRTTFEWVLRRMALDEGNVTFEGGRAVVGLVAGDESPPIVTGVRLDDGTTRRQRPRRGRRRPALGPSRLARANSASSFPTRRWRTPASSTSRASSASARARTTRPAAA